MKSLTKDSVVAPGTIVISRAGQKLVAVGTHDGNLLAVLGNARQDDGSPCWLNAPTETFSVDVKEKTGTVADYPDADLVERAVRNAGRLQPKVVRWGHISEAFGLGSNYSWQLCKRFGLDPDEEVGVEPEEVEE